MSVITLPVIMFIAELLWFMPLFLLQGKKNAAPKRYTYFAILTGLLFGGFIGTAGTIVFSKILMTIAPNSIGTWGYKFFYNLFSAGVAEEFVKFFIALIFIKLARPVRKLDYIFIMGGAALGFALTESVIYAAMGMGGIINALFPMHIMWQFFMGAHYYESVQAKNAGNKARRTKELLLAFGFPILMHGFYDFMIDVRKFFIDRSTVLDAANAFSGPEATSLILGLCAVVAWFLFVLAFVIVSEVRVAKLVKKSREADRMESELAA